MAGRAREFRSEQALVNMQKACEILGVELSIVCSERAIGCGIARQSMDFFSAFGGFSFAKLCSACSYGYRSAVYRAAEKWSAPLILWGNSQAEKTVPMQKKARMVSRDRRLKSAKLLSPEFMKLEYLQFLQRREFPVPGNSVLQRGRPSLKSRRIREVSLFDYVQWDREKIKQTIMNELGWQKSEDSVSTWRSDCKLHPILNFFVWKRYGCTKNAFGYCNMINGGYMDRETALTQEKETVQFLSENIEELLAHVMGLTEGQIAGVLRSC